MHYLRGENLWVARVTQRWSWVLRKIMLIRPQIRPFIKSTVGNGLHVNAWEDFWMGCGPLSSFILYRFIHASGLSVTTTVSDLASAFSSSFPDAWTSRFPTLVNVSLPVIRDNAQDGLTWIFHSRSQLSTLLWMVTMYSCRGILRFVLRVISLNMPSVFGWRVIKDTLHRIESYLGVLILRISDVVFVWCAWILMTTSFLSVHILWRCGLGCATPSIGLIFQRSGRM